MAALPEHMSGDFVEAAVANAAKLDLEKKVLDTSPQITAAVEKIPGNHTKR